MDRNAITVRAFVALASLVAAVPAACSDHISQHEETSLLPMVSTTSSVPTLLAADGGAPVGVWRASIQVPEVLEGAEEHVCQVVALDTASPLWVSAVNARLSPGSHHLIVDRLPSQTQLSAAPFRCDPTGGADVTRLLVAQQLESGITLPNGVAYRLEAHQHILLQLHYVNVTDAPMNVQAEVELREVPEIGYETPTEAHSIFTGTFAIELQPRQPGRAQVDAVIGSDKQGTQRHVFALTSHMHRLGVRASIYRLDAAGEPSTLLHASSDWAEPPLSMHEPTLTLQPREPLRLICEYLNQTDQIVRFGPEADAEMCMLWVHYYDR